jgi:drug/metabolite transporter (DMT)-like permease
MKKGIIFAAIATLISGWAVFINKFALANWGNSDIYTTEKNMVAALLISGLLLGTSQYKKLINLSRSQWLKILLIALVGGSIPFVLFFKGLSLSPSSSAAFWNKTLFIWVAILAYPILRERLSKIQLGALVVLVFGNLSLFWPKSLAFDPSTILILAATIIWAIEYILVKKYVSDIAPEILAWGRMFFGSFVLLIYLFASGVHVIDLSLSATQIPWILIVGITLSAYVITWYRSLKYLPVTVAAAILTLASPITTLLNRSFEGGVLPHNFLIYLPVFIMAAVILSITPVSRSLDQKAII